MKREIKKIIGQKLIDINPQTKAELDAFKRKACQEYKIPYPGNIELLETIKNFGNKNKLVDLLKVRPVRSLSGIINVSVLTKPYPCPGKCLYCPAETGFPKSYLSGEPAAERAKRLKFNPYLQVKKRIENLKNQGHATDKIELRIIGGTWSYYPKNYQTEFVAACFAAANSLNTGLPANNFPKKNRFSLEKEQKKNEKSSCRIVALSIETRPDFIDENEIASLRKLGVTKVEMGIQSIYDDVLEKNLRGHDVSQTIDATKLLKNHGFKVSYQVMLNLYGSSAKRDAAMMEKIFSAPAFRPDALKIYPCAVLPEAPLYKIYKKGLFKPYSDKTLAKVISEIKKTVPHYVRIERIIRDIPSPRIIEGTKSVSNLRQVIAFDMKCKGWSCKCIRCREIKNDYDSKEKIFLVRRDYQASDGLEIFLTFENKSETKLFSLLRLRIQKNGTKPVFSVLKNSALIRELHTYGIQVPIAKKGKAAQHQGLGRQLVFEAEKISKKEFGAQKIAVISGVGVRNYWRKFGYRLKESYMAKKI